VDEKTKAKADSLFNFAQDRLVGNDNQKGEGSGKADPYGMTNARDKQGHAIARAKAMGCRTATDTALMPFQ
jgi:hypothetical protein